MNYKLKIMYLIVVSTLTVGCITEETTNEENELLTTQVKSVELEDSLYNYFDIQDNNELYYSNGKITSPKNSLGKVIYRTVDDKEWEDILNVVADSLNNNETFIKKLPRPLDYLCPKKLLAAFELFPNLKNDKGEDLTTVKALKSQCEYVGFDCEDKCGDSTDPYLNRVNLKGKTVVIDRYKPKTSMEIYPYRMHASSFINNNWFYSSAGSETYFQKRQRVWTGIFSGMQWRWRAFDPDRNGIRTYCVECNSSDGCGIKLMKTDLDTFWDTEDITVRCSWDFFINKIQVSGEYGNGAFSNVDPSVDGWNIPKNYKGGVVGTHYVRHGDHRFKAKTSVNMPSEIIKHMNFTYR